MVFSSSRQAISLINSQTFAFHDDVEAGERFHPSAEKCSLQKKLLRAMWARRALAAGPPEILRRVELRLVQHVQAASNISALFHAPLRGSFPSGSRRAKGLLKIVRFFKEWIIFGPTDAHHFRALTGV